MSQDKVVLHSFVSLFKKNKQKDREILFNSIVGKVKSSQREESYDSCGDKEQGQDEDIL